MFQGISTILIWSENYQKLAAWYQEKLELSIIETISHPDDTGILFEIGNILKKLRFAIYFFSIHPSNPLFRPVGLQTGVRWVYSKRHRQKRKERCIC